MVKQDRMVEHMKRVILEKNCLIRENSSTGKNGLIRENGPSG